MRIKKNYRKIYEDFHGIKIPPGMHIHHIDGNPDNNDPLNLQMVTPEEHAQIHMERGDPWFCYSKMKWIAGSGNTKGMKGKSHSEETKKKITAKALGRKISEETKEKMSKASKGKPKSEEHRNKMRGKSSWMKGKIPWMKGKSHS